MPGTSRGSTTASVAARVMKPAPVMPDAPFEVSIATSRLADGEFETERLRNEQGCQIRARPAVSMALAPSAGG